MSLKSSEKTLQPDWWVYILECNDNTLYTGITTDVRRRLEEHNDSACGAKYTRGRRPVMLVYWERAENRVEASRREYAIKQLSRKQKQVLIVSFSRRVGDDCVPL